MPELMVINEIKNKEYDLKILIIVSMCVRVSVCVCVCGVGGDIVLDEHLP